MLTGVDSRGFDHIVNVPYSIPLEKTENYFPINLILDVCSPIIVTFVRGSIRKQQRKGRIMVVAHDAGAAKIVNWILSQNLYSVKYFHDPEKALKEFKKHPTRYLATVADIRMRGISGFEFARRIRKLSEARIILLTDFEMTKREFLKVFPSSKIDAIVVKPTSPTQLMKAVTGTNSSNMVEV